MPQASSFTPIEPVQPVPAEGQRAAIAGALDGAAFTIPLSLGSVTLIFSKIGDGFTANGIMATLVGLAVLQLVMAGGRRPVLFSARFFESTTLAAMLDRIIERLPVWHLPDTSGVRLALLCALVALAGLVVGLLYAMRADRYSRHIPAPVFAGFSNSIAVALLVTQAGALAALLPNPRAWLPGTIGIVVLSLATAFGVRRWMPRWPAAACAVTVGLLVGLAAVGAGYAVPMLGTGGFAWTPPVVHADFRALAADGVAKWSVVSWLMADAAILGIMVFINSTITSQAMSHADEAPPERLPALLAGSACMVVAGAVGAAPLSGSLQSSTAATRKATLSPTLMRYSAATLLVVALSGVLAWVPLAAVVGALVCEAVYMADRKSLALARQWIGGHPLTRHAREDLALVVAVTASAVFLNMVAAVIAGLLLGLLLFASRQMAPPVRGVLDGTQLTSNCARPRADLQALAQHGASLKVVELEGDLFFGTMDTLERSLREVLQEAAVLVVDWTDVRHVDSSVSQALGKFQRAARTRGVPLVHVMPGRRNAETAAVLTPLLKPDEVAPDLDRALEAAENHLLHSHPDRVSPLTTVMDTMPLLEGLDDRERAILEPLLEQRVFARGDTVVAAGDPGDDLMMVLQGSGNVLAAVEGGLTLRVAGVRRGAVIGELAFLDRAPRSATIVADEDMLVAVLHRSDWERLSVQEPLLVQKVLANLAANLASRLRHTTRLAARRHAGRHA